MDEEGIWTQRTYDYVALPWQDARVPVRPLRGLGALMAQLGKYPATDLEISCELVRIARSELIPPRHLPFSLPRFRPNCRLFAMRLTAASEAEAWALEMVKILYRDLAPMVDCAPVGDEQALDSMRIATIQGLKLFLQRTRPDQAAQVNFTLLMNTRVSQALAAISAATGRTTHSQFNLTLVDPDYATFFSPAMREAVGRAVASIRAEVLRSERDPQTLSWLHEWADERTPTCDANQMAELAGAFIIRTLEFYAHIRGSEPSIQQIASFLASLDSLNTIFIDRLVDAGLLSDELGGGLVKGMTDQPACDIRQITSDTIRGSIRNARDIGRESC